MSRTATLLLKTNILTLNTDTQYGICDLNRQNMTWNNVNFVAVLGNLYDEYDTFNLSISCAMSGTSGTITAVGDRAVVINISGLPFLNQTYNVKSGNNGTFTPLCGLNFNAANTNKEIQFSNTNPITFRKVENTSINISYTRVETDTPYSGALVYPQMMFILTIIGVDKTKDKHM